MTILPEIVKQAWADRDSFPVFTTVDSEGIPNSIYVGIIDIYDERTFVIANNKFCKTKSNIDAGSKGSILFITKEKKSFQIKGSIDYHTSGPLFDFMKSINLEGFAGHGATTIRVEEVYSGAERLA